MVSVRIHHKSLTSTTRSRGDAENIIPTYAPFFKGQIMNKLSISERINARLREPEGEIFRAGKWRFWFALAFGLSLGSAILTAMIFAWSAGSLAVLVGLLVLWVLVGTLHYSDSEDPRLARGVSLLDSVALCFVVGHFCFVMWAYGHLLTLRSAEARYDAQALAYNEKQEKIQADNARIAASAEKIAEASVRRARLENDTAYQTRRAVEGGLRVRGTRDSGSGQGGQFPALATAPIELEKPKAPEEFSANFLSKWDAWIRGANFGELILAAITLIYIRNRSAKFNAASGVERAPSVSYSAGMSLPATVATLRRGSVRKATVATVAGDRELALQALRADLGVIASYLPGRWFRADLIKGGVSIRLYERDEQRRESTIAETRQSNKILAAVGRPDFQERLRAELIACGFPIGKGSE